MKHLILILALLCPSLANAGSPWWSGSATRACRVKLTPSGSASCAYFPFLLTASNLPNEYAKNLVGSSSGADCLIASDTGGYNGVGSIGARLPVEVVSANFTNGGGSAEIWSQVPTLSASTSNTYVWLLYGAKGVTQPASSAAYGSQAVWCESGTQNYGGVWHLVPGTPITWPDSTSLTTTGTNIGSAVSINCPVGGGIAFNGNQAITTSRNQTLGKQATVSYWWRHTAVSAPGTFDGVDIELSPNYNYGGFLLDFNDNSGGPIPITGSYQFAENSATGYLQTLTTNRYDDNNWHYIACVFDSTQPTIALNGILYIDGVPANVSVGPTHSALQTSSFPNTPLFIGGRNGVGSSSASMGEIRIAAGTRSSEWIRNEYANQSSPATFAVPSQPINLTGDTTNFGSVARTRYKGVRDEQ